jgi:DNA replicative helicase MCM subunit Mcm2 (Cdc46/Mcm family)
MQKSLLDAVRLLFPLGAKKRASLGRFAAYCSKAELSDLRYLAKLRKVGFHEEELATSPAFFPNRFWPQLTLAVPDERLGHLVERVNARVADTVKLEAFNSFTDAMRKIPALVAQNIVGMDGAKEAAALMLFAQEPVHVLLLGDPGTGKTEILRSVERLAANASFSLGSGASKAGLTGMYEGKEFLPGVLVEADEGIALLDELNLLKQEDRAGLYSAMEKGFITYDKRGHHERFDARVRILATANPKGDKFMGKDIKFLKAQLPFDDALLSRFHLLFLIRKPSANELTTITRKIVADDVRELPDGDARFVQEYVRYAQKLNVSFSPKHEAAIVTFIEELKRSERAMLVEVGPRLVIGVIRMAKAYARARLSRNTDAEDVENAMRLMRTALVV